MEFGTHFAGDIDHSAEVVGIVWPREISWSSKHEGGQGGGDNLRGEGRHFEKR